MAEIKHIVFDIGKVLIHYDPNIPYARLIPDDEERRLFFETVCTNDWNLEQDRGRSWEDAEALLIAEHPSQEGMIRAFRKHWHEMVSYSYDDSVALMRRIIAAGYDVTMLTNFNSDTFAQARTIFPFLNETRGVTVSGDVFLIKPDKAIYNRHTADFELDPASTVFIDDSLKNVEGAKAAGWQAIHFTSAEQLERELRTLGVQV
ncbi:HAD family phosphatase [Tianweitania sp. BSSL-BM11]|uniref:HAD family phosphatase n=1 Tax=Tianweitania aestuarii TaxID=2814886 RepID=A0ABS5RRW9_9HYPH|nr:HAD family phosphatase [Tianweitania aestuarii]MBS9719800.1 HAD family phosphatase [Tianweitania aestuarii]